MLVKVKVILLMILIFLVIGVILGIIVIFNNSWIVLIIKLKIVIIIMFWLKIWKFLIMFFGVNYKFKIIKVVIIIIGIKLGIINDNGMLVVKLFVNKLKGIVIILFKIFVVKNCWLFFWIMLSVIGIVKINVGFIIVFKIVFVNKLVCGLLVNCCVNVKLFILLVNKVVVNIVGLVFSNL